jgi:SNF2 family DNA or RNA helicase
LELGQRKKPIRLKSQKLVRLNDREMNYEERLKAAAKFILADDSRAANAPLDVSNFGVTATLKPYQVDGVSWLIRRHTLGVNVVLGTVLVQLFFSYVWLRRKLEASE